MSELMKATLILANGSVFSGTSIGGTSDRICEMVFNTSMTGYQAVSYTHLRAHET